MGRKIELIRPEEIEQRVDGLRQSLEKIYGVNLEVKKEEVPIDKITPTEPFLEKDKLELVIKKVREEGYSVPVIILKHRGNYYVIDGHHRVYSFNSIGKKTIEAYVLLFPSDREYRPIERKQIESMAVYEVAGSIEEETWKARHKAEKTREFYERIHGCRFDIVEIELPMNRLIPTQPFVEKTKFESYRDFGIPITCIKQDGKYYVLDGHVRSLVCVRENREKIRAFVLMPEKKIELGIALSAEKQGLRSLEDIKFI